MKRKISYFITETNTIKNFLKEKDYPNNLIKELKSREDGILLNGEKAIITVTLNQGDTLTITGKEDPSETKIKPIFLDFPILYEDEDLMLINKPANMPTHISQGNHENTLANALTYYFYEKGKLFTFRSINRLDRDTTGIVLVAKNNISGSILQKYVKEGTIKRKYLAICTGKCQGEGVIHAPIGRTKDSIIKRMVTTEGDIAITHFKTLSYHEKEDLSLVSLSLETGRTHQIRVHLKHIGHPIIGDFLYHPDFTFIQRQALHSHEITFCHPITHKFIHMIAPLPKDFCNLFPPKETNLS